MLERPRNKFKISDPFLDEFKVKRPDWGPLGEITYYRTYARTGESGLPEQWWETCKRVVEGTYNIQKAHCEFFRLPWNNAKAQSSSQEMYRRLFEFKWTPPGRGLWSMGTDILWELGSINLYNCSTTSTKDIAYNFSEPFTFLMDFSMNGVGVGADTRGANTVTIKNPKIANHIVLIEDSREGWVESVEILLDSFVGKGSLPTFDYTAIRKKGMPLKRSGGIAPGPAPLVQLHIDLVKTLCKFIPKYRLSHDSVNDPARLSFESMELDPYKISSTQIVDLFNYIGKCVVSGGKRRTAELMMGSPEDKEFLNLKADRKAVEDRRFASNNSVFATVGMDYSEIAQLTALNGEPGYVYLDTAKKFGRLIDPPDYSDGNVLCPNPCIEIVLEDRELCNIDESFPSRHESLEDYLRTLKYAYLYCKTVTLLPTHNERTNAVQMSNRRLGISMSGIVQNINKRGMREHLRWCDEGYKYLKELDKTYSKWLCVNKSIKITAIKPSGSVSLLMGATPGIHYPESEFYIRNIRVEDTSSILKPLREAGYHIEQDVYAPNTVVVSFPVREPLFKRGKKDISIWEQMELLAQMQAYWADNSVSATIHFKPEEAPSISRVLELYETRLKSVSFLPLKDHGYKQAPYIPITEQEYIDMSSKLSKPEFTSSKNEVQEKFCSNDTCSL